MRKLLKMKFDRMDVLAGSALVFSIIMWIGGPFSDAVAGVLGVPLVIAMIVAGVAFYALPSIIASRRRHREALPIMAVNLLFGWTFIGWALALVWSLTSNVEAPPQYRPVEYEPD
jgi:hypothetical protein